MSSVKQKAIPIILTGAFITCWWNFYLWWFHQDWYTLQNPFIIWFYSIMLISYIAFLYQEKKMNQWVDSNTEEAYNNRYPLWILSLFISFTSIELYKEFAIYLLSLLNLSVASSQLLVPFIFFFLCYFLLSLFVKIFDKKARILYIYWIWALFALWKILAILYSLL